MTELLELVAPFIRGIHQRAELYDDPLAFRPERFVGHATSRSVGELA